MVGDDIVGDVEGAQKAGMSGVQVRTGKYRCFIILYIIVLTTKVIITFYNIDLSIIK